jgi:hypothetical protein
LPSITRVERLASVLFPTFRSPSSQVMSPSQLQERAFSAICGRLGLPAGSKAWAPAYVVQALNTQLGRMVGLRGFGAGLDVEPIARALAEEGATISATSGPDPAFWPPVEDLDFVWAISEEAAQPPLAVFVKICSLLERVRPSGCAVLVFPFEHGRMPHERSSVCKRSDVEILSLTLLGHGHNVAQLKFRPGARALPPGTRTPYGLIVRRAHR